MLRMKMQTISVRLKKKDDPDQAYAFGNLDNTTHMIAAEINGKQIKTFFELQDGIASVSVDEFMQADKYVLLNFNIPINGPIDGSYGEFPALDRFKVVRVPTSILLKGGATIFKAFDGMNLHIHFGHKIGPHNTVYGDTEMDNAWKEINKISNDIQQKLFEMTVTDCPMPKTQEEVNAILKQDPTLNEALGAFCALGKIDVSIRDKSMDDNIVSVPCGTLFELDKLARMKYINDEITLDATFTLIKVGVEIYNAYKQSRVPNQSFNEWLEMNPAIVEEKVEKSAALAWIPRYIYDQAADFSVCQIGISQGGNKTLICGNTGNADTQKSIGVPDSAQVIHNFGVGTKKLEQIFEKSAALKKFQAGAEFVQVSKSASQPNAEVDYDKVGEILSLSDTYMGDCEDLNNGNVLTAERMQVVKSANDESIQNHIDTLSNCGNTYPTHDIESYGKDFLGYGSESMKHVKQSNEVITPKYLRFLAAAWPRLNATVGAAQGAHLTQEKSTSQKNDNDTHSTGCNIKESTEILVEGFGSGKYGGHAYSMVQGEKTTIKVCDSTGDLATVKIYADENKTQTHEGTATKINVANESDVSNLDALVKMELAMNAPKNQTDEQRQKCQQIGLKLETLNQQNKCVMRQDGINILSNIMTEIVQGSPIIISTPKGASNAFYQGDLIGQDGHYMTMDKLGYDELIQNASYNSETQEYSVSKEVFKRIFGKHVAFGCLRSYLSKDKLRCTFKVERTDTEKGSAAMKLIAGSWALLAATDQEIDDKRQEILGLIETKYKEVGVDIKLPKGPNAQYTDVIKEKRSGIFNLRCGDTPTDALHIGDPMAIRHSLQRLDPKEYNTLPLTAFTHVVAKRP